MLSDFEKELTALINRHSQENGSNTPDYMLAGFLVLSLQNFDRTVMARTAWYGGRNGGDVEVTQPAKTVVVPIGPDEFRFTSETRHQFFVRRAQELGAFDADADYGGEIGKNLEQISALIEAQHHSGSSFVQLFVLFRQLVTEWSRGDRPNGGGS